MAITDFNEASRKAEEELVKKISSDESAVLHGLRQQATLGDCNEQLSEDADPETMKYHFAWQANQAMSKVEAEAKFLALVNELCAKYEL